MDDMTTAFSTQLQKLRKEKGITQDVLANYLGVCPQTVSKWENGSYPDGDLLPKIADFFEVSIDYLYGRREKEISMEQQIMDALQNLLKSTGDTSQFFEQMMRYSWAMLLANNRENKYYYDRNVVENGPITGAGITIPSGFSFMRMNRDLEYFFLVKEPEGGLADRLKITEEMVGLFRFLSDRQNLKVLYYMLSLKALESVHAETIAKLLELPLEKVEKALEYLCRQPDIFRKASIVDEHNRSETIYQTYWVKAIAPVMLLICADLFVHAPELYQNQVGWREEAWFTREDLDFLKYDGVGKHEKKV